MALSLPDSKAGFILLHFSASPPGDLWKTWKLGINFIFNMFTLGLMFEGSHEFDSLFKLHGGCYKCALLKEGEPRTG